MARGDDQKTESTPSRVTTGETEPVSGARSGSLGSQAVDGSLWIVVRFGAANGLRLVTNMILTRMLLPEAFGLMALVSAVMMGLALFSDIGIAASVVQNKRGADPEFLNTAWTLQVIRGIVLALFAAALSHAMASVYSIPDLRPLIMVAGLTAVIAGFNSVSLLRMRRNLEIKKLALIDTSGQLLAGVATITAAWLWPSVWALVLGGLVGGASKLAISHLATGYERCRFRWESEAKDELLHFGKWIFVSTILFFLAGQADRLIFGKLLSVSMLGVFSIAVSLAAIPTQIVWQLGNSIVFPALSRRRGNEKDLRRVYIRTLHPLLALGVLPVALLGACGPEVVEILYDVRYADAGWMVQVLAVGAWLQVPQASSGAVAMSLGQPRWLAFANGMKFASMLVLLPIGYRYLGPVGAIGGLVGAEFFRYATLAVSTRRLGLSGGVRADISFSALAVSTTLAGLWVSAWIGHQGGGAIPRLFGASIAITTVLLAATMVIFKSELPRVREWIRRTVDRRAHSAI